MDYKEKYQKALERAKKGLPIDEVFPELKAIEDERIIDDAIQIIRASRLRCAEYGAEADKHLKAIAYLEKQKDVIGAARRQGYEEGMEDGASMVEDAQKEQQPAEWKPQSESLEALMYAIEGKWEAIKPTSYLSRRLEDLYEGLVNTFNVEEKYLGNLPKTEYTEKDIEEIKTLEGDDNALVYFHELISFGYIKNFCDAQTAEDMRRWLHERLKSLRPQPHWKPSEEQIDALETAVSTSQSTALESLYEQLKSL